MGVESTPPHTPKVNTNPNVPRKRKREISDVKEISTLQDLEAYEAQDGQNGIRGVTFADDTFFDVPFHSTDDGFDFYPDRMEYLVRQAIHCFEQSDFTPQSGSTPDNVIRLNSGQWQQETTTFGNEAANFDYSVNSSVDPTRRLQDVNDATFAEFFSRPIAIRSYSWGTGTVLSEDFNPWADFFTDPRVINRIANFNLLRAKLNVKIVLNGNGFHYGRILAGYVPLDTFDEMSSFAGLIAQDNIQLSQCPHVFLNPTLSTGGSMQLPFFWHKNYLSVPQSEWNDMGRIYLRTLNALEHANDASDQVTITVFAWASDVELAMPTNRNPSDMVPQSGKEIDEANLKGIVSGPASTVARVAGALSGVPTIGPFAMATSTVAGAVASAARSLGYSRPPVTKNPDPFRPHPTSLLSATMVPDTAQKLTVDDKQELTVDPCIAGIGSDDPLSIVNIAKRESYLHTFDWNIGTGANTLLYNYGVSPCHWDVSGSGLEEAVHLPACATACLPFSYWTGTINFRFQVVCSAHHKGKLQIAYDPAIGFTNGETSFNTNYIKVVDIADENDFTVSIGMAQERNILPRNRTPGGDAVSTMRGTTPLQGQEYFNGVLSVKVLNELTTPNSSTPKDIQVNVFISAGDDFEVFAPGSIPASYVFKPSTITEFENQSGVEIAEHPDAVVASELDKPQHENTDQFAGMMQDNSLLTKVFMGESITSMRQILKRYNFHRRDRLAGPGQVVVNITRPMYPIYRGKIADAVDTASVGPYNYVNTTMLHWMTAPFQGWRGSIRWKYLFKNQINTIPPSETPGANDSVDKVAGYVSRTTGTNNFIKWTTELNERPVYSSDSEAAWDAVFNLNENFVGAGLPTMMAGATYFDGAINPNVEFEVPFYNEYRFKPGKTVNYTKTRTNIEHFRIDAELTTSARSAVESHCAAGEDFQVYFWTGMPRIYLEGQPPLP
ncbi:hypothetical protein 2 [Wenzhou picorna-like virus 32]|uniref:hypothetical protein 2 n=1 Tax=Wenzhou picorna-like virus 32 TaxID=1923618 RepID=UPI00090AB840|nr:hypothetical protein 2 [Wenzhou picorna-like virus 32]APG78559.1 hypothetical protein 2 [Wenzhou picorna-like virus 32]